MLKQQKFEKEFDNIHQNFIKRLSETYKGLTVNDKKLCAYLKMNLVSKDIAPLMNISVRGVEIGRYRLRKKLNLDRHTNLTDFLQNFQYSSIIKNADILLSAFFIIELLTNLIID